MMRDSSACDKAYLNNAIGHELHLLLDADAHLAGVFFVPR